MYVSVWFIAFTTWIADPVTAGAHQGTLRAGVMAQ